MSDSTNTHERCEGCGIVREKDEPMTCYNMDCAWVDWELTKPSGDPRFDEGYAQAEKDIRKWLNSSSSARFYFDEDGLNIATVIEHEIACGEHRKQTP